MKVAHVITGLGVGGAETMLSRLVSTLDPRSVESTVISLTGRGPVADQIEDAGVPVDSLGMARGGVSPRALVRLRSLLSEFDPDVVQTWMYHADLLGGLVARSAGYKVVWSLRQSNLSGSVNRATTLLTMWTAARLSEQIPARIICGSEAARRSHVAIGYAGSRMTVIANGFDTSMFRPDETKRDEVRLELDVPPSSRVVGLIARFDPQKDHETFVMAAGLIARAGRDVVFVLCGEGVDTANERLGTWLAESGAMRSTRILGRRGDVARLLCGFDVAVSSSIGEGMSNVVGEAMSAGVPCVVTDVGDSARLVGDTGLVVPPARPDLLAAAVEKVLDETEEQHLERSRAARLRIETKYRLASSAESHSRLWSEVAECAD